MREACLDLLFANSFIFITREEFAHTLDGWDIEPHVMPAGNIGAVFVSKGPEFHFQKFDPAMQATRDILKKYPGELIAKHGFAMTRTPHTDRRQQRFNERLGFYRVGEDESFIHYRIDHLRKKESPCQLSQ